MDKTKRAERLHQEERVKGKFKRIARDIITSPKLVPRVFTKARAWNDSEARERFIEWWAQRHAHGSIGCPCSDCREMRGRGVLYDRDDQRRESARLIKEELVK